MASTAQLLDFLTQINNEIDDVSTQYTTQLQAAHAKSITNDDTQEDMSKARKKLAEIDQWVAVAKKQRLTAQENYGRLDFEMPIPQSVPVQPNESAYQGLDNSYKIAQMMLSQIKEEVENYARTEQQSGAWTDRIMALIAAIPAGILLTTYAVPSLMAFALYLNLLVVLSVILGQKMTWFKRLIYMLPFLGAMFIFRAIGSYFIFEGINTTALFAIVLFGLTGWFLSSGKPSFMYQPLKAFIRQGL